MRTIRAPLTRVFFSCRNVSKESCCFDVSTTFSLLKSDNSDLAQAGNTVDVPGPPSTRHLYSVIKPTKGAVFTFIHPPGTPVLDSILEFLQPVVSMTTVTGSDQLVHLL